MTKLIVDRQHERRARAELQELMPLIEVKKLLNVSWYRMMEIVRSGELPVYNVSTEQVSREDLPDDFRGLRARPTDVKSYIQSIRL
jgi:hypothetical protein